MEQTGQFEQLAPHLRLWISPAHKFGTDAFLLSDFAAARRKDTVCDLCAGCGIVGALWFRDPMQAPKRVYAVELMPQAVAQMQCSVEQGGLPADRFIPICADLRDRAGLDALIPPTGLDLVTCNPPYTKQGGGILSETLTDQAARHEMFCRMEDVCAAAARLLRYGGRLCLCQRPERLADAVCAMRDAGLEPKRLRLVQQRPDTAPWLFLLEGRKGGNPGMTVLPPLVVEGATGFSAEMLRIYRK